MYQRDKSFSIRQRWRKLKIIGKKFIESGVSELFVEFERAFCLTERVSSRCVQTFLDNKLKLVSGFTSHRRKTVYEVGWRRLQSENSEEKKDDLVSCFTTDSLISVTFRICAFLERATTRSDGSLLHSHISFPLFFLACVVGVHSRFCICMCLCMCVWVRLGVFGCVLGVFDCL